MINMVIHVLSRFTESSNGSFKEGIFFFLVRILAGLLIFIESATLAKVLSPELLGQYMFSIQSLTFLYILNLGVHSSFVYSYFRDKCHLEKNVFLCFNLLHLIGLSLLLYILYPSFAYPILFFTSFIPYIITEPINKVEERYYLNVAPKLFTSILVILLVLIKTSILKDKITNLNVFLFVYFVSYWVIYVALYFYYENPKKYLRNLVKSSLFSIKNLKEYLYLIRFGFTLNSVAILYNFLVYIDRFLLNFLKLYEDLAAYTFSFTIVTGALLLISSFSYINQVKFGDIIRSKGNLYVFYKEMKKKMVVLSIITFVGFLFILLVLYEMGLFSIYKNLSLYLTLLFIGYFSINFVLSYSHAIFFFKKQRFLICLYITSILFIFVFYCVLYILNTWSKIYMFTMPIVLILCSILIHIYNEKLIKEESYQ